MSLVVGLVGVALFGQSACSSARDGTSGDGSAPVACVDDAECASGPCRCGLCALACDGGVESCSAQAGSACFGSGSLPHSVLCGAAEPLGICLPGCAGDSHCAGDQECLLGACVPRGRAAPNASLPARDVPALDVSFGTIPSYDMGDYAAACPPENPCPTLEQALALEECVQIIVMCGLWRVQGTWSGTYWYDGFGVPPVAAERSDAQGSTVSIECERIDLACTTCGVDQPRCDAYADWLPGPVPETEPVPGCTCESVDGETARVSLDCFCGVHGCASYADLAQDCSVEHLLTTALSERVREACGQVWFHSLPSGGPGIAFDPVSGELVAAEAVSAGPVTLPCGTRRVVAGAPAACEASKPCVCSPGDGANTCERQPWFPPVPY